MEVMVGDETGLLKLVNLKTKTVVSTWGRQSRAVGVLAAIWCEFQPRASDAPVSAVASANVAGNVEVWDPLTQELLHSCKNVGKDVIFLASRGGYFIIVTRGGLVRVFPHRARNVGAAADDDGNVFTVRPARRVDR